MANIRIDNFSGDTVTVFLDDISQTVEDDGRVTFDSLGKGVHTLRVHRTRVAVESVPGKDEEGKTFLEKMESGEKSFHVPLDYVTQVDLNSSKAVLTLKADITGKEGKGLDVIFASYCVAATGAKLEDGKKEFANKTVAKKFVSHHIRNIFFPAGIGGIVILLLALISLFAAASGNPVNLGGTVFSLPWSVALTAVASAVCIYNIVCIFNVMKTSKKLNR